LQNDVSVKFIKQVKYLSVSLHALHKDDNETLRQVQ